MTKIKLTIPTVQALPFAEKGKQVDYYDTDLDGFGVRASHTGKNYFVRGYINGKRPRVMLGSTKVITCDQARRAAKIKIGLIESGTDPNREKQEQRRQEEEVKARDLTLQDALDAYFEEADLKPRTVTTYQDLIRLYLSDWYSLSVTEITPDMIKARHSDIAKGKRSRPQFITVSKTAEELATEKLELLERKPTRGQRSKVKVSLTKRIPDPEPKPREAAADNCMRTLGAVLSYYHDEKNQSYMNPVQTLSKRGKRKTKTGKWFKVGRRTSLIKSSELPAWHKAVMALSNTDMRDFLLFLLFTGLRRGEAAKLKWEDVDFVEKVYKVLDTKNGIDVILPLSDYLFTTT